MLTFYIQLSQRGLNSLMKNYLIVNNNRVEDRNHWAGKFFGVGGTEGGYNTTHTCRQNHFRKKTSAIFYYEVNSLSCYCEEILIQKSELSRRGGVLWLFQVKNAYAILHGESKLNCAFIFLPWQLSLFLMF